MKTKKNILLAFALSFFLGCCIVLPNIIINKGIFDLVGDFNYQQIPFLKYISNSIRSGDILWSWTNGLGSDFISTFSFYNLFSPFNIIIYIFGANCVEYLVGPMFILKYAIAGTSSYLFLSRYVKKPQNALLGSILYAFSGFQLTNTLFYHFHDFVALFPFLLYSLDNLVYDNKKFWFAINVFILTLTNWFFTIGAGIFTLIYIIVKFITKSYKFDIKKIMHIIIEGIIGVAMCAFILLPSFYFTINNPRLSTGWNLNNMFMYTDKTKYLNIINSFIFPSDVMNGQALFNQTDVTSLEAYLPIVGITLVITYLLKNKKDWLTILIIVLILMMFIPIFNSSFILFQFVYYARWFYIPTLFFSLASIRVIEENKDYSIGIFVHNVLLIILILGIGYFTKLGMQMIYNQKSLIFSIIVLLMSMNILLVLKNKKNKTTPLLICSAIFIIAWGNYTIYGYKSNNFKTIDNYKVYLSAENDIKIDNYARTNSSPSCTYNYGYLSNIQNIKEWNSNIEGKQFELYNSLEYMRYVASIIPVEDISINNILGVKYIISCYGDDLSNLGYKYISTNGNYKIYENPNYKEFGYYPTSYISKEEFAKMSVKERKEILENTIVLTKEQINIYKDIISTKTQYKTNEFSINKNTFKSKIISTNDTLAIYSIPYTKGWEAYNNGEKVKIEEVNNGLMAIKINKGENVITFKYITPGLKTGLIISTISSVTLVAYVIIMKRGNKK